MNIAICDDDLRAASAVERLVDEFMREKGCDYELYVFTSGKDLLKRNVQFDIVYLDIEMPELNGLEVTKRLFEKNPCTTVLIITSHQHYLDDAMELRVYRYISKPFEKSRFFACLDSAYKNYLYRCKPIKIKSNDEISKINSSDIVYISIEREKVFVHTYDEDIRTTETFNQWMSQLDGLSFFKVHQSFIVNLAYVTRVHKRTIILTCKDEKYEVPVSSRKYVAFKKALFQYLKG